MSNSGPGGKSVFAVVGTLVAALAAVAACSDGRDRPDAAASPTAAAVSVNTRYDSVYDLREKVEDTGYACTGWEILGNPAEATERAACTDQVVLSIHTDAAQVQRSIDGVAEITVDVLGRASVHVVGPNWSVNCGEDLSLCEDFRQVLGGEISQQTP